MTQLNTPYPATQYLTGFLRSRGFEATQRDLALALVHELLSPDGLARLHAACAQQAPQERSASVAHFVAHWPQYRDTLSAVLEFLQGRNPTLAHRIATRGFLPEGPRFAATEQHPDAQDGDGLAWAFGSLGTHNRAQHLATLCLNDVADVMAHALDPRFAFVRYGESLAASQAHFDPLHEALLAPPTVVDETLHRLTVQALQENEPDLVLLSVPFPGTVYGALRIAQSVRRLRPQVRIVLGGGFVNTELRELSEPRLFDFVDDVCLDAGERPILAIIEHWQGLRSSERLVRTFRRQDDGRVRLHHWPEPDVPLAECGTPTWHGLEPAHYLSLLDMLNPMHRLWSDGRWNKLTVAHGCYWKQCSFCDVGLDYISRYEVQNASLLADRMERLIEESGQTGFHFVDEAAPPKALRALAEEIQRRRLPVTWWGNVRFEKTFSPELAQLLADSGCVAISGGLEVASDRLLKLMSKGVSVAQVARVTRAFADAGVLVHAYLMYGFPTQTLHDTVDALEYVRQLFLQGCIHSGFFHRFVCTVHSPVGLQPEHYGITLQPLPQGGFARNDVAFIDPTGVDHDRLGLALKKALYNYMHGMGLEEDVRAWFAEFEPNPIPKPRVARHAIERALEG